MKTNENQQLKKVKKRSSHKKKPANFVILSYAQGGVETLEVSDALKTASVGYVTANGASASAFYDDTVVTEYKTFKMKTGQVNHF